MHPEQQDLPHTDRLFVPLHTSLLEKWDLQMISVETENTKYDC